MKSKKLLRLSGIALCLALLMFGVWAVAKSATLNVNGTVGFVAHDCELTMYGSITGAVSDASNMDASKNETFYFGDEANQFLIKDATTLSFENDLTDATLTTKYPIIYFNDAGNTVPAIVMTFNFTNISKYAVSVSITEVPSLNGVKVTYPKTLDKIPAGDTMPVEIKLELTDMETDINVDDNFNIKFEFKKGDLSTGLKFTETTNADGEVDYYTLAGIGTCTDTQIVVPSVHNGKPVRYVASDAFKNNKNITSIELPSSVEIINSNAFYGCTALTNVVLNEGLKHIGDYAFYECSALTTITIPNSLESFNNGFLPYQNNLQFSTYDNAYYLGNSTNPYVLLYEVINPSNTSINISGDCRLLYTGSFSIMDNDGKNLVRIKNITLPSNIIFIGKSIFTGSTRLTNVTYNCNATMSDNMFQNCDSFQSLTMNGGTANKKAFTGCGALYYITIGSGVKDLGYQPFYSITTIESVEINCENIPNNAFQRCTGMTRLSIGNNVKTIGTYSFADCTKITSVNIPGSVKKLNESSFYGCSRLMTATFNEGTEEVYGGAFSATNVYTLTFPKSLKKVTSLSSISGLQTVTFNSNTELEVGAYCFRNSFSLSSVSFSNDLQSLTLNEGVFSSCNVLTYVALPSCLTNIPKATFNGCIALASITIPENVESIGDQAFKGCTTLNNVVIPAKVATIGAEAFNAITVYCKAEGPSADWAENWIASTDNVYYYSATQKDGNYWYYNSENIPTVWNA